MAKAASRALRALTEVPSWAVVAGLLQRHANDPQLAAGDTGSIAELDTIGTDGRTLDAHVQDAVRIALAAPGTEAQRLRRALLSLAVVRALSTRSQLGREWDPVLCRDEALELAQNITTAPDPIVEVEATVLELRQAGLIVTRNAEDAPALPWETFGPYCFFFCRTDALFQHWEPEADAKELCRRSWQTRVVRSVELDTDLRWGPRRLNSATTYAQLRHWITVPYRHTSDEQYVVPLAFLTEEGRLLAET